MAGSLKRALLVWALVHPLAHADCTAQIDALESRLFTHPQDQQAQQQLRSLLADPRCRPQPAAPPQVRKPTAHGWVRVSAQWHSNPRYVADRQSVILQGAGQAATYRLDRQQSSQAALQVDLKQGNARQDTAMMVSLRKYRHLPADFSVAVSHAAGANRWMARVERINEVDAMGLSFSRRAQIAMPVQMQVNLWHYPAQAEFDNLEYTLTVPGKFNTINAALQLSYIQGLSSHYPGAGTWRTALMGSYAFTHAQAWRLLLSARLSAEQDNQRWSEVLAHYGPRNTCRLAAHLRAERPIGRNRYFFMSVVADRQWSNIPLFSWNALTLAFGIAYSF